MVVGLFWVVVCVFVVVLCGVEWFIDCDDDVGNGDVLCVMCEVVVVVWVVYGFDDFMFV